MGRFCLVVLLITFSIFIHPSSVLAYHDSFQNLYDWGPWYETSRQHVLAVATNSAENKEEVTNLATSQKADVKTLNGLLPNSPLYFIKPLTENVELFFRFNPVAKTEKQLAIAEERLAEMKFLLERKDYKDVGKILAAYINTIADVSVRLTTLEKQNAFVGNLTKTVESETAKQSLFLEKVQLIVPEEVRDSINKAVIQSKQAMDTSADVLHRDPIPADLRDRIESLNIIRVISDAEASALLSLDSRIEARRRMENLVSQNLLPPSDIKRLDEAQRGYYPLDYHGVTEANKIYELKNILDNVLDGNTKERLAKFGSSYKRGDPIPPDLKPWWLREQRLQELQYTLRPDLIVNSIIPKDTLEYKKIENIVQAFRPTTEQLQAVDTWVKENPNKTPPPEIVRIVALATNLGTPIPWTTPESLKNVNTTFPTQYEAPAGFSAPKETPKTSEQTLHPYCLKSPTRARHAITGEVKTFPTTCLPPSWYTYPTDDVYRNLLTGEESVPVNATAPHVAVPECGYGVCKVYRCEWGWRDIDGNFQNGCEAKDPFPGSSPTPIPYRTIPLGDPPVGPPGVPVTDSTGNVYVNTVAPHVAVPSCGFGVCIVQTCESGWYDRNGIFTDGCESQESPPYGTPYASPTSGTYGTPTSPSPTAPPYETPQYGTPSTVNTVAPHVAVPSCGFGVCKVQTCESGWYDKNGVFDDGCESNTP